MEHSVKVRRFLKDTLTSILGEELLEEWFVEFLPDEKFMKHMSSDERTHRHIFFMGSYISMAFFTAGLLELLRRLLNCWIRRHHGAGQGASQAAGCLRRREQEHQEPTSPRAPLLVNCRSTDTIQQETNASSEDASPAEPEAEESEGGEEQAIRDEIRERVKTYTKQDLFFIAYQHVYIFLCLGLTSYGFLNDYLCPATGLDYELYFPWFFGTAVMHLVTLIAAFAKNQKRELPMFVVIFAVPKTLNPFDGHLGTLRDAVAAGIYAQESFTEPFQYGPLVLSFICTLCIFLPNVWIFANIHPFRDFQELYWPILVGVDRPPVAKSSKKSKTETGGSWCSRKWKWLKSLLTEAVMRDSVFKALDEQTREHKQLVALFGDLPQALVGCIFMFFYVRGAYFIIAVTSLAFVKTLLIVLLRPHILCCLASRKIPWQHVTVRDVSGAVDCQTGCENVHRSRACRGLLRDPETSPDVRKKALDALGKIHSRLQSKEPTELQQQQQQQEQHEEWERECQGIKETVLWEYATNSEDKKIVKKARKVLNLIDKGGKWNQAGHRMKRVRSSDLEDVAKAVVELADKYPEYANAFKKDLHRCLTMKLPPFRQPVHRTEERKPTANSLVSSTRDVTDSRGRFSCACSTLFCGGNDDNDSGEDFDDENKQQQDRESEHRLVLKVRYSAARALALLGKRSRAPEDLDTSDAGLQKETTRQTVARAVDHVAKDIIKLLDRASADVDLRMAALTAVVHFHGDAAVLALQKAQTMLKKHGGVDLLIAEILLIELLRRVAVDQECLEEAEKLRKPVPPADDDDDDDDDKRKRAKSVIKCVHSVVKELNSPDIEKSKLAKRVLLRTGGRAAKVIYSVLEAERLLEDDPDLEKILSKQKKWAEALNQDGLLKLCPAAEGMNLKLDPDKNDLKKVDDICEQVSGPDDIFDLLKKDKATTPKKMGGLATDLDKSESTLAVFLTDLEPDDDMCIMQVCNFLRKKKTPYTPLIIFCADFEDKDMGHVFALKLMLAALIVGEADYKVLVPAEVAKEWKWRSRCPKGADHPSTPASTAVTPPEQRPEAEERAQPGCTWFSAAAPPNDQPPPTTSTRSTASVATAPSEKERTADTGSRMADCVTGMYEDNLKHIVDKIGRFGGKEIRFYICAPGRGNLGAIVEGLKQAGHTGKVKVDGGEMVERLTIRPRSVYLYSGQFNVQGMEMSDRSAMKMLTEMYNEKVDRMGGVLNDISKYPFFGEKNTHDVASSFNTFALPSFTPGLSLKRPLVHAIWSRFNSSFNKKLIAPKKVFQVEDLDEKFRTDLQAVYDDKDEDRTKEYARMLCEHESFRSMVKRKKQTTVQAFACDSCDAPLCDQLLFLDHWAEDHISKQQKEHEDSNDNGVKWPPAPLVSYTEGAWVYDTMNGFTSLTSGQGLDKGLQARRPQLREAYDIGALYQLQTALHDSTFEHLDNQEDVDP